jgi:hypothetical protein
MKGPETIEPDNLETIKQPMIKLDAVGEPYF